MSETETAGPKLAEFEHYDRGGGHIIEVPSPVIDDSYFHGDNPLADAPVLTVGQGESTASAQQREGGAGWNQEAGVLGAQGSASDVPDHSARKADIQGWLDERQVEYPSDATKDDLLKLVNEHGSASAEGSTPVEDGQGGFATE